MKRRINFFGSAITVFVITLISFTLTYRCTMEEELVDPLNGTPTAQTISNCDAAGNEFVPGEILVKFKANVSEPMRVNLLNSVGVKSTEKIVTRMMKSSGDNEGITIVKTEMNVNDAIKKLNGQAGVDYAEPNYIYQHCYVSNDPYYTGNNLWGMYGDATSPANQYGSQAGEAWAAGHVGSSTVYVGIIDQGVMYSHTDLSANMWVNPYDPVDGVDNDGNGYIDDVRGWDFYNNDNSTYDGTSDYHGTHVAGTIGATGGNSTGVAGICWNVKIITAKFLGSSGGTTANAILAIDYLIGLKTLHGLNIVAINNSWGGGGYSTSLYNAIGRANTAGILFICAAGNGGTDGRGDNNDIYPFYPANYSNANVISVMNITKTGARATSSNYGATTCDLGAPGSAIYSTYPGSGGASSYASLTGTSMATPHVTGACALYKATNTGATAAQIKTAIMSSTVATTSLSGRCVSGGRLNVSGF